jgi:hypothetical protein
MAKSNVKRRAVTNHPAASTRRINGRSWHVPKIGAAQERADHAIGLVIEAIQQIAYALDAASVAIMYCIPARGAELDEASRKLDWVKEHFARALRLIDKVKQPPMSRRQPRVKLEFVRSNDPMRADIAGCCGSKLSKPVLPDRLS